VAPVAAPEHGQRQLLPNRRRGHQALERSRVHDRALPDGDHEIAIFETRLRRRRFFEDLDDEHAEALPQPVLLRDLLHLLLG